MSSIKDDVHDIGTANDPSSVIGQVLQAIEHQVDTIFSGIMLPLVQSAFQANYAVGIDLDNLGALFGITRYVGEDDTELRTRITAYVPTLEKCTGQAIKDLFYYLSGQDPEILEAWTTKIYLPGETVDPDVDLLEFTVQLPFNTAIVQEKVQVEDDGNTVYTSRTNFSADPFGGSENGAWLATDEDHDTNLYSTHDADTGAVTLNGGPYATGTWIELRYEVIPEDSWDPDVYGKMYEEILNQWRAAGVDAIFRIVQKLREWFSGDQETLNVTDEFNLAPTFFDNPLLPGVEAIVESEAMFDFKGFNAAKFDQRFTLKYDQQTAEFAAGYTVTGGTSGASAPIYEVIDEGTVGRLLIGSVTSGPFQDNEDITDDQTPTPGAAKADGKETVRVRWGLTPT